MISGQVELRCGAWHGSRGAQSFFVCGLNALKDGAVDGADDAGGLELCGAWGWGAGCRDIQAVCDAAMDCADEEHARGAGDDGWKARAVEAAADCGSLEQG